MILFRKLNTIFAIFFERIGFFINFVLLLPYKALFVLYYARFGSGVMVYIRYGVSMVYIRYE